MTKSPDKEKVEDVRDVEPYKSAISKIVHTWNCMRENLGLLFCRILGVSDRIGLDVWRALKNDRARHDLLEAALSAACADGTLIRDFPKAREDIEWLLERVKALAVGGNGARHAAVVSLINGETEIRPLEINEYLIATKFLGKDTLNELECYAAQLSLINEFATLISVAIACRHLTVVGFLGPWPDRPFLASDASMCAPKT
jgi:hypothetical protein